MSLSAGFKPEVIEHGQHGWIVVGARTPIVTHSGYVDSFIIWEGCDKTLLAKGWQLPMPFYPSSTYTLLVTIRQMLLQTYYSYWKVVAALY